MPVDSPPVPRLRSLPFGARFGLTALVVVLLIGQATSLAHIYLHNEKKDNEPGLSMLDIAGTYHGVEVPAPLRVSLEDEHPEGLPPAAKAALLAWLQKDPDGISRAYDDLDLGDLAPSELIAANCLSCHALATAPTKGAGVALDSWDAVKRIALPKSISPPPISILVMSTHAHALTLGIIGVVVALLLWFSRWPRRLGGLLVFLMGVGLFCDIGGWWVAREYFAAIYAIILGGAAFNGALALALLLTLVELWWPA